MGHKLTLEEKKEKIGLVFTNRSGEEAEIINYNSCKDIDIKFLSDGEIRKNVHMSALKKGSFQREDMKGLTITKAEIQRRKKDIYINKQGYHAKILVYRNCSDIDIIFLEDNSILSHRTYQDLVRGSFPHPENTILTGQKLGKLKVIGDSGKRTRNGIIIWLCECECGNDCYFSTRELNERRSCGCRKREVGVDKAGLTNVICSYKSNAKKRNIAWNLSNDEVENLIHKPCFYCGAKEQNQVLIKSKYALNNIYKYNGIDRLNSDIGYETSNVVPCCKLCNQAKNNLSQNDFYLLIGKIYNKHKKEIDVLLKND